MSSRSRRISTPTTCSGARTLRSPHAHARIVSIDVAPALARSRGVAARYSPPTTCPASPTYGLIFADQPALARDFVRYEGRAGGASSPPITPRPAGGPWTRSSSSTRILEPLVDRRGRPRSPPSIHPDGNVIRRVPDPPRRPPRRRRRRGRGHLRDGDAGPGVHGTRIGHGRARPAGVASTCTWPPSGSTRTASRPRPAWGCPSRGRSHPPGRYWRRLRRTRGPLPCSCTPRCWR